MKNGRVAQFASPREIYQRPVERYVASFTGEANFLAVQVERELCSGHFRVRAGAAALDVKGAGPFTPNARAVLLARPESLAIVTAGRGSSKDGSRNRCSWAPSSIARLPCRTGHACGSASRRTGACRQDGPVAVGLDSSGLADAGRRAVMQRLPRLALGVPAVLLLLVFLILPYVEMITMSFRASQPGTMYGLGYTVDHYRKVATDTLYLDALARSLLTAAAITAVCLVISFRSPGTCLGPVAARRCSYMPAWRRR